MSQFARVIRLDDSDLNVFEPAAEIGEWAISGAFAFSNLVVPLYLSEEEPEARSVRHIQLYNALSQTFYDGRFTHTRFTNQNRIVFRSPTENLQQALNLI